MPDRQYTSNVVAVEEYPVEQVEVALELVEYGVNISRYSVPLGCAGIVKV